MEEFEKIQEADWVVAPRELAAPVITRRFYVGAAGRAELQISALGFMIPYVNDRRVGDEYFRPSNSLFCRRKTETFLYPIFDELTYRCYYSTFDIPFILTPPRSAASERPQPCRCVRCSAGRSWQILF